ncbi:metallophosphoesterase [Deinococcus peraridilitoris]|uniref:Calcineurin-like phosphoesterase n=1 Tax=Deinococcus peraridilitoris (strain DSM 19664 / LMG 22246 / CIP 109416 / KR-200) TaxID=937777 RepID=K9ZYK9_DEIPD|nr:metallophosphoesterase [Deinococcus peraridilitoris]AFZ66289.1 Calcineurin-like phosphoesterase [Deinococcus peraridilitoris DSM 19664]
MSSSLLAGAEVVYAVPDLHGRLDLLEGALAHTQGAHLVVLGDVIDRGPGSLECVRLLLELEQLGLVTLLWGNHEQMAYSAHAWYTRYEEKGELDDLRAARSNFRWWQGNGGDALQREAGRFGVENYPPELVEYFSRLQLMVFVDARGVHTAPPDDVSVLAVHAAPPQPHPDYPDPDTAALWLRPEDGPFPLPPGVSWSVHGHTPLPNPRQIGAQVYTDLGAVRTGRLCLTRLDPGGPRELLVLHAPKATHRAARPEYPGELPFRSVFLTS